MFKNATFLSFYLADNQLFGNSETLVNLITFKKRNSLRPKVYIVLTSDNIHNPYL